MKARCGGHAVIPIDERHEDQKFKEILSYGVCLMLAWTIRSCLKNKHTNSPKNFNKNKQKNPKLVAQMLCLVIWICNLTLTLRAGRTSSP